MKKNNVAKVFFISLMKSILFIIILLCVGFGSYKISYTILSDNGGNVGTSKGDIEDIIEDAQTDEISKNLIYVTDEDRITNMMLEICNTKTNNMDYITVPVRTEYTIPATMYQKLCTVNQEIPQIVRIGRLKSYFSRGTPLQFSPRPITTLIGREDARKSGRCITRFAVGKLKMRVMPVTIRTRAGAGLNCNWLDGAQAEKAIPG